MAGLGTRLFHRGTRARFGERGVVGSRSRLIAPRRGNERVAGTPGWLVARHHEDKSRIGVINDCGVINCGLH